MNSSIGWRVAGFVVIASVTACLGAYSRAVDETRTGLLGLSGRDLRGCLGVPSDFVLDGDLEHQTYRFDHDEPSGVNIGAGGVVIGGRSPADQDRDRHGFPSDDPNRSFCQLDFEFTKGRVTQVFAQGRTREGMNADSSCMLRARRCLPYTDE